MNINLNKYVDERKITEWRTHDLLSFLCNRFYKDKQIKLFHIQLRRIENVIEDINDMKTSIYL